MDAGAVVLEANEGESARAAFLVTNELGRVLTCDLLSSEFTTRTGEPVKVDVSFEPAKFQLAPGQNQVVQVAVKMDRRLQPGVAYSGSFAIRGLDGYTVAAVLRRTHSTVESPITAMTHEEAERHAGAQSAKGASSKTAGAAPARSTRKPRK